MLIIRSIIHIIVHSFVNKRRERGDRFRGIFLIDNVPIEFFGRPFIESVHVKEVLTLMHCGQSLLTDDSITVRYAIK